jgi:hypothetical protein
MAKSLAELVTIAPSELPTQARWEHEESLLDDALRETFPASDPIAVTVTATPSVRPLLP